MEGVEVAEEVCQSGQQMRILWTLLIKRQPSSLGERRQRGSPWETGCQGLEGGRMARSPIWELWGHLWESQRWVVFRHRIIRCLELGATLEIKSQPIVTELRTRTQSSWFCLFLQQTWIKGLLSSKCYRRCWRGIESLDKTFSPLGAYSPRGSKKQ